MSTCFNQKAFQQITTMPARFTAVIVVFTIRRQSNQKINSPRVPTNETLTSKV